MMCEMIKRNDLLRLSNEVIKPFYYQRVQETIAIIRRYLPEERCLIHKPEGAIFLWLWFKDLLEEKLGIRVMVDNDCVMLALAEKWQHDSQGRDFCVINVDYGIGSSFVINNQIYRGSLNGSGQIGHTILDPDGVACDCGRYGCLETIASLSALKKQARVWLKSQPSATDLNPETLSSAQLIHAWQKGNPWLQNWVDRSANAIGLSLYNFLNILNINQIWLYGRSCAFGENWLNSIIRQTGFNPFDRDEGPSVKATQIGFGQLSRAQQILGIGYLYVEAQLSNV
jgi:predicted NBD/HSP70 family sugar kinase